MESKNVTIEDLQIGKIRYSFNAIISFSQTFEREGEFSPSINHVEDITGELDSDIHAWDTEKEEEYTVTDPLEEAMVLDWVDWFTQLEKAWEN